MAKQNSTSLGMLISIVNAIVAIKRKTEKKETIMLVLHDIE